MRTHSTPRRGMRNLPCMIIDGVRSRFLLDEEVDEWCRVVNQHRDAALQREAEVKKERDACVAIIMHNYGVTRFMAEQMALKAQKARR